MPKIKELPDTPLLLATEEELDVVEYELDEEWWDFETNQEVTYADQYRDTYI